MFKPIDLPSYIMEMWFGSCRWGGCSSMATCSLACGLAAFVFLCIYLFNTALNRRLRMLIPFIVLSIAAGIFGMILFIVFCTSFMSFMFWCCSPEMEREILEWKLWWVALPFLFLFELLEITFLSLYWHMVHNLDNFNSGRFCMDIELLSTIVDTIMDICNYLCLSWYFDR